MQATVWQALAANGVLTALIPTERWFRAGSVKDVPRMPFVVFRWLSPVASDARGRFLHQLRIDVHDNRGVYDRIKAFNGNPDLGTGVVGTLQALANYEGPDGRITQADFLGFGGDQEDADYKSNYGFTSWQIIGRSF